MRSDTKTKGCLKANERRETLAFTDLLNSLSLRLFFCVVPIVNEYFNMCFNCSSRYLCMS